MIVQVPMIEVKFSVVIPCYNDKSTLRVSVASCLNQSLKPHEVILVDDGSDRETITQINTLYQDYGQQGLKVFFLKSNRGVSAARNTGIEHSTGNYICFQDSDDIWHRDKLAVLNSILREESTPIAISHSFSYDIEELTRPIGKNSFCKRRIRTWHLLLRNPITTPSLAVPREIVLKFRESMRYAEDHDYLLRLSTLCEIYYINEKLVFIGRTLGSKGGLSGSRWKMRVGEIRMYYYFCLSRFPLIIFYPIFILFSMVKHARSCLKNLHFFKVKLKV